VDTLASPRSQLADRYDVVVVGSGYGGGVMACRLARAGLSVAVLERGRELHPGQYPTSLTTALRDVQVHTGRRDLGRRTGLFDFRITGDVGVLIGCGLGGTSLINANVALEADPRVFEDERWPEPLRHGDPELSAGLARARTMLGSTPTPLPPDLLKRRALEASATGLRAPFVVPDVNVRFTPGRNAAGVDQPSCSGCGDCVTGCNVGAKNTVLMTYLPDAVRHGASVFTELSVRTVSTAAPGRGGRWCVHVEPTDHPGAPRAVHADTVVLAAGTLGSTEILLRSAAAGLEVSPTLGLGLTGNADFLAFAYDTTEPINGMGQGPRVDPDRPVGPCITGAIDLRHERTVADALLIEEGSIPSPLVPLMPIGLLVSSLRGSHRTEGGSRRNDIWTVATGLIRRRPKQAAAHTQTFLAMGTDDDRGELTLQEDRPVIVWPRAAEQRALRDDDATLTQVAEAMGGSYLRSPVWRSPLGDKYLTVHPLGGCEMGADAARAVVNHRGQVFRGRAGTAVHEGLVVADGSIVPTPLGANPSLTIAGLAERIAAIELHDRGVDPATAATVLDEVDDRPFTNHTAAAPPTLSFRERMAGPLVDPEGELLGELKLRMELETDEVEALLRDLAHPLHVHGTARAPRLDPDPLLISGTLRIIEDDPDAVDTRHMRYDLVLEGPDGRQLTVIAIKDLHDDRGWDAWRDTTTARVTVREGAAVLALGRVHIDVLGVLRMALSMRVDHVPPATALLDKARFVGRFAGALLSTYGKVLVQEEQFKRAEQPVPVVRPLRLGLPETHWCRGDGSWTTDPVAALDPTTNRPRDDVWLRLVRYQGGTKGPVLVAPGFAMATSQFLLDTTPTNLTEHLVEAGYDVWLFDYRASIDLPSARTRFTLDDVATRDWPTAIDEVRRVTGRPDVQIVAHCLGSMTALMSVLAGAEGVRSIVSSQVTLHPVMAPFSRLKAWIHLPELLEAMGIRRVEYDVTPEWTDRLLDLGLRLNPLLKGERCSNPSCRWVFGFFGPTHVHDQLDERTHESFTRLFGVGDLRALAQTGEIVRRGHVVDHRGLDVYLPMVERLAIPVTFLAGARNRIFEPETSLRTYDWLRAHNDPGLYERIVLPDYAHLDGLVGKHAHRDVFPIITDALDAHN